jgi:glycosyltransferase involved in cell wall biosynthesis
VRSDVADMMRAMDLFVLPSANEGISNTVLEAMASALPVVAARVGGNPELIDPGRTGMLYEAADPSALASAVTAYVDSQALRDEHGRAARERVLASFSIESMVDRYAQFYDRMLSTRK